MSVVLTINKKKYTVDVEESTPLLWVLRDTLNLVGTKYGCGIEQCGACTVHVNGSAIRSCTIPISALKNLEIMTIEGLSDDNSHPVQIAWKEIDVPQCGYCQSGQIMTAAAFINRNNNPSKEEIKQAMKGNICRCATYKRIEKAVEVAAKLTQENA